MFFPLGVSPLWLAGYFADDFFSVKELAADPSLYDDSHIRVYRPDQPLNRLSSDVTCLPPLAGGHADAPLPALCQTLMISHQMEASDGLSSLMGETTV